MLAFNFLGFPYLALDGNVLPGLATRKAVSLLGYLTLHPGKSHTRESLAEMFWEERTPDQARRSLNTCLWQIRTLLKNNALDPDQFLRTSSNQVSWLVSPNMWLDFNEFKRLGLENSRNSLERAVELYRGPFLDGIYDSWCVEERFQLEDLYLIALGRLAEMCKVDRTYRQAIHYARRIIEINPLQEDARALLMEALYQTGQRNDALAQFQDLKRVLEKELRVEPAQELQALFQAISAETVARIPSFDPQEPISIPPSPIPIQMLPSSDLVLGSVPFAGREPELHRLETWWADPHQPVMVVQGEAGVGKTRLVQEFTRKLNLRAVSIGLGRCFAFERSLPYQAAGDALRSLALPLQTSLMQSLPAWVVDELFWLLPELSEQTQSAPLGPKRPQVTDPIRLFEAILRLLNILSERQPVVIVLEDVHWAPESTLQLLEYLLRRIQPQRVKLILTVWQEPLQPPVLKGLLHQISAENLAAETNLERLDRQAVQEWILRWSGTAPLRGGFAERIALESEGNPFFIVELVKSLFETGQLRRGPDGWEGYDQPSLSLGVPRAIRELVLGRIDHLPPLALTALQAAAVTGCEFDLTSLQSLLGLSENRTLAALDDLLRSQLIGEGKSPDAKDFEFSHHMIQKIIYQSLPQARRASLHRRLGKLLVEAQREAAAGEIFHHFQEGGDVPQAVYWGLIAGERALGMYAYRDALKFLTTTESLAEREPVDAEIKMRLFACLAVVYGALHEIKHNNQAAESLLSLARQNGSPSREIEALFHLGIGTDYVDPACARQLLEEARRLAERHQDPRLGEILYFLGVSVGSGGDWLQAIQLLRQVVEISRKDGRSDIAARAYNGLGLGQRSLGQVGAGLDAFEQGLALADSSGDRRFSAVILHNIAETYAFLRLKEPFAEYLQRSNELFDQVGYVLPEQICLKGMLAWFSGFVQEACELIQHAIQMSQDASNYESYRDCAHQYVELLVEMGNSSLALEFSEAFFANPLAYQKPADFYPYYYRGLTRLAAGHLSAAAPDLERAVQAWLDQGTDQHALWRALASLARLYRLQDRLVDARGAAQRAVASVETIARSLDDRPVIQVGFLSLADVQAVMRSDSQI